jgi:hypothetical protein
MKEYTLENNSSDVNKGKDSVEEEERSSKQPVLIESFERSG